MGAAGTQADMSNFVSCDRNIENLNLLADLILARGFGSSLGAAAASWAVSV